MSLLSRPSFKRYAVFFVPLLLFFSSLNTYAGQFGDLRFWRVKDLVELNAATVELKAAAADGSMKSWGNVTRSELLMLLNAKERVSHACDTNADLFIVNGDSPNAFATPITGRNIVAINVPMLRLVNKDIDAVAALLGHELAHLKLRHLEQQKETRDKLGALSLVLAIAVGAKLGSVGVTDPNAYQGAGQLIDLLASGTLFAYSRDQEREADSFGLGYMERGGFNPQGAVRLWQEMVTHSGGGQFSIFNTHPNALERLKVMQESIKVAYPAWREKLVERTSFSQEIEPQELQARVEAVALNEPMAVDKKERAASFQAPADCVLQSGEVIKLPKLQCVRQGGKFNVQ